MRRHRTSQSFVRLRQVVRSLNWLSSYGWQLLSRKLPTARPLHLIIAVADHFEPAYMPEAPGPAVSLAVQEERLERWCRDYPKFADDARDSDGRPFCHTYFYPAEQYEASIIDRLAEHCAAGWGELEIHLHHGTKEPDTAESTRQVVSNFRDQLSSRGCLSRWNGSGPSRFAFVHGNWALANSANGRFCGVDDEMQVLADLGCYADFTLPSAPSPAQVAKINSLYECALPLDQPTPHRRGTDLRSGSPPVVFPIIVQGPLGLINRDGRVRIENGELSTANPPTLARLDVWRRVPISVVGRPDWIFVKLHCHGMDPRDESAMYGQLARGFAKDLSGLSDSAFRLHFVTAREMTNIALAACDGKDGSPGQYRDYRLQPIGRRSA